MKRFIVHSLFFAVILLVINATLLDFATDTYFRSYETVRLDYTGYLLGDSHAVVLTDFLELSGAYNFGKGSDSYEDMFLKAHYLVKRSPVKLLIVSADDHTLSLYREHKNNADRSVFFSTPSTFGSPVDWFNRRYVARYIVLLNPKVRDILRSRIKALLRGNKNPQDRERVIWSDLSPEQRASMTQERIKEQFPDAKSSFRNETALNAILSLCAERRITVIGVKYPLTEEYTSASRGLSYGADEVFARHGVPVLDYTHAFKENPEFFKDPDHLNVYGAERFSEILRRDVLTPFANGELSSAMGN